MKRIMIIMAAIIAMTGCKRDEMDEVLLQRSDISLTWKSELQMCYNPLTCQLSQNAAKNIFRVHDDNLGNWFTVRCSEKPSFAGQELTADVSWTTKSNIREEKGLQFTVEKIDGSGLIWLWNKSDRIGLVVKNL